MARIKLAVEWGALGANLGSALFFTLLLMTPFLLGGPLSHWLLAAAMGIAFGLFFYLRRERFRDQEPGPDADETRFPR